jgi:hypothetical protein
MGNSLSLCGDSFVLHADRTTTLTLHRSARGINRYETIRGWDLRSSPRRRWRYCSSRLWGPMDSMFLRNLGSHLQGWRWTQYVSSKHWYPSSGMKMETVCFSKTSVPVFRVEDGDSMFLRNTGTNLQGWRGRQYVSPKPWYPSSGFMMETACFSETLVAYRSSGLKMETVCFSKTLVPVFRFEDGDSVFLRNLGSLPIFRAEDGDSMFLRNIGTHFQRWRWRQYVSPKYW